MFLFFSFSLGLLGEAREGSYIYQVNKKNMKEFKKELEKGQGSLLILLLIFIPIVLIFGMVKSLFTNKNSNQ